MCEDSAIGTVATPDTLEPHRGARVPPQAGSTLSLAALLVDAGSAAAVGDPQRDSLLFVHGGSGSLTLDGAAHPIGRGSAALVLRGETASLAAAEELAAVSVLAGTETDLHAPMGEREIVVRLEDVEQGAATGSRSFQVLFGPHNGSLLATFFVGYIPPGAAKLHYHLYDEIVWILDGRARLHADGEAHELPAGSAFRLTPRQQHIVENLDEARELTVLGVFTPAGSPSAAYRPATV
ncbi:MAG TPA: cupin domain-containing protein [Gaiellaceae bacterium]|nr:cupin domain-containing protein [Gaiellaceae bacterium]